MQELHLEEYQEDWKNKSVNVYHLIKKQEIVELVRNTPFAHHLNSESYKVDLLQAAYLNGVVINDKLISDDLRPLEIKAYVLQF